MQDDTKRFYDLTAEQTAQEWYPKDVLMPTIRDFCSLLPDRSIPAGAATFQGW